MARKIRALWRQIARLDRRVLQLQGLSSAYAKGRAGWVLLGVGVVLLVERGWGTAWGLLVVALGLAGFWALVAQHNRVKRQIRRYALWRHLKATHIARLQRDWESLPSPALVPEDPEHAFAADLNLLGARSVLHLLDTTTSQGGQERLRDWLLQPTLDAEGIRQRQAQVRELQPLAAFRDHLALCGALVGSETLGRWDATGVLAWLQGQTPTSSLAGWVGLLGGLAAVNLTLMSLAALSILPGWWTLSFMLYALLYLYKHGAAHALFVEAYRLEQTLVHVRDVLEYLETRRYSGTPLLAALCAPFWQAASRPSVALTQIIRIAGAAGVQQSNMLGFAVNALVPWDLYFAHRLTQYKTRMRTLLPTWLNTWYELEALNSLAHFGALHPDYILPTVLPTTASPAAPILQACGLGHPLLPAAERVCNDVTFTHLGEMALITGSNMSGKSTFLRTIGVNLCLAYAGAPVNAAAFQTMPLRLYTCIKVSDSVTDGISYFYAEVRRLKRLLHALEAPDPLPLCFLIDEIFRGTNNRERLIGSRAYIQALTRGRGIGALSTHDLELVTLADTASQIHNYHFREDVHEGRMVFDYRLRLGPCPTTNALKIMQLEGLPVQEAP